MYQTLYHILNLIYIWRSASHIKALRLSYAAEASTETSCHHILQICRPMIIMESRGQALSIGCNQSASVPSACTPQSWIPYQQQLILGFEMSTSIHKTIDQGKHASSGPNGKTLPDMQSSWFWDWLKEEKPCRHCLICQAVYCILLSTYKYSLFG